MKKIFQIMLHTLKISLFFLVLISCSQTKVYNKVITGSIINDDVKYSSEAIFTIKTQKILTKKIEYYDNTGTLTQVDIFKPEGRITYNLKEFESDTLLKEYYEIKTRGGFTINDNTISFGEFKGKIISKTKDTIFSVSKKDAVIFIRE